MTIRLLGAVWSSRRGTISQELAGVNKTGARRRRFACCLRRRGLPTHTHADASGAFAATNGTTEGDIGIGPHLARIAHRQGLLAAEAADTHAEPVGGVDALRTEGHLRHRRTHRAHAIDPTIHCVE